MTDDVEGLPYFQKAVQQYASCELFKGILSYSYDYDAPLGENGVGIWLYFEQRTMRN